MRIMYKQKSISGRIFTVEANRSRKTLTIKEYYKDGSIDTIYRTNPMGSDYSETWTANDICNYLRYSCDYYIVRK